MVLMFEGGKHLPAAADVNHGADGPGSGGAQRNEVPAQADSGCVKSVASAKQRLDPQAGHPQAMRERGDPARRLLETRPDLSAGRPLWAWQVWGIAALAGALIAGAVLAPRSLALVVTLASALPFFSVYLLRGLAVAALVRTDRKTKMTPNNCAGQEFVREGSFPTYAVLVPLYDEAEIVPGIVAALGRIDYPTDKLAIRFVAEVADTSTRQALQEMVLPPHMSVVVAPQGEPRTKPRALDIALDLTPGAFVVVYDAEDQPEPDQLKLAVAAFQTAPTGTACLQAQLNTFNPNESWLSRQFTIEYSALFDVMLPALERFGLPVPLGGTSNHFRREALEEVLAWDPYNVTEDADLGIRLARFGKRVGTFCSTTWEEAPPTWSIWLGQRTRWLKGWMQTYLVHMRSPSRLRKEIGWWPFWGVQMLMGAMIASALVHPWFYLLLGYEAVAGNLFSRPQGLERAFWFLAIANLLLGYLSVVALGAVAVWRRGRRWLLPHLVFVPVYWLAISVAAYKALVELFVAPYHWEKTKHRAWITGLDETEIR